MLRPQDLASAEEIKSKLIQFSKKILPLPGLDNSNSLDCFVLQIIDSIKRVKYINVIKTRKLTSNCIIPQNLHFDPIKASIYYNKNGNLDESFWLAFLSIHFGKNKNTGWSLLRRFYLGRGNNDYWTWENIISNRDFFILWLDENQIELKNSGYFGNHRKYQSLGAYKKAGTGSTILSYIDWINDSNKNHLSFFNSFNTDNNESPKELFGKLYKSLNNVIGFGRTAKFDYLTLIGKLRYLNIEPNSTYLDGATGPLKGAKLLYTGSASTKISTKQLNGYNDQLEQFLNLYFGMQILEDSLCNWQKSPLRYIYFNG